MPLIAPVMQTILLLAINATLHASDIILGTTGGAPGGTTNTVMSHIVNSFVPGFAGVDVNVGYGCALSLITSVLMMMFAKQAAKITRCISLFEDGIFISPLHFDFETKRFIIYLLSIYENIDSF